MIVQQASPLATLALLAIGAAGVAAPRQPELETWIDQELTPYLEAQLSSHPRFRNESLRFVVMKDSNPQPLTNTLALALRDRLQDALMDTPGIRIAWRPDQAVPGRIAGSNSIDCSADVVHYYIGLEIAETRTGEFELSLRALDLEDRRWVTGFGKTWTGSLTSAQHRAWREVGTDYAFLGERDVPFDTSQTDLLAAQLAHKLGCTLLQQVSGEYIATPASADPEAADHMIELVINNLAAYQALQLAADSSHANAAIDAKAHRVDDDLYQYWVTIRPKVATPELAAISASAYVIIEPTFNQAELVRMTPGAVPSALAGAIPGAALPRPGAMLTHLRLIELDDMRRCSNRRDCFALQTRSSEDAVVFFLNHQLNNGLVRLADAQCERRASARIIRANESVNFSLLADNTGAWIPGEVWELSPSMDTYYVVAASDNRAARALARHIERLPQRCTASVRRGMQGAELQRWLEELDAIADNWKSQVDWQLIRVRNVY